MDSVPDHLSRRQFVAASLAALGYPYVADAGRLNMGSEGKDLSVRQVIDLILADIPGERLAQTVDTLKSGSEGQLVTGIVTTMFATLDLIRKAIDHHANFIIAHEPTFYNHLDDTSWLREDKVVRYKKKLLEDHGIAVWRFHDYWHLHRPDGVRMGVLTELGWDTYYDAEEPRIITLPPIALKEIIEHVKERLGIGQVRFIGDPEMLCRRVGLLPGASGGRSHISLVMEQEPDLLICGEVAEWETAEYIRDATLLGQERSLIVLGHAESEEPGMRWLAKWLKTRIEGLPVNHIPSNNPFRFA